MDQATVEKYAKIFATLVGTDMTVTWKGTLGIGIDENSLTPLRLYTDVSNGEYLPLDSKGIGELISILQAAYPICAQIDQENSQAYAYTHGQSGSKQDVS